MPVIIEPSEKQSGSEFAKLLEEQQEMRPVEEGKILKGRVLKVTHDYVVVDVGFKSEGQIPIHEFKDPDGNVKVEPGSEIEVYLEKLEDEEGVVKLSKERADALKAWDTLVAMQEKGELVEGNVLTKVKGGLMVDVGVKAFLPGSQIDLRPARNLDKYVGKKFKFKILKLNKRRGNIVLSRKEALLEQKGQMREDTLQNITIGGVMEGTVKNITDYGAFVDLGGIDGLLHVTDMSWGRVGHPSEIFQVGDTLRVMVLKYDESTHRVSLGLKQLQDDPWLEVEGKFPVGSRIRGKVVSLADYGAFVELMPGVEGLVHISEISWNKKLKHPSQELSEKAQVEAIVLDCDIENRRIALGMKQLKENPWDMIEKKMQVGAKVSGTIRNITDFGLFLDCGVGVDGLVHISDIDWVQNFHLPQDLFKKGETLEVVVAHIDRDNERFSLSRKQLTPNPWEIIRAKYAEGTRLKGKVLSKNPAGAVIEIHHEIAGLLPVAEGGSDAAEGEELDLEVAVAEESSRRFHLKRV